MSAQDIDDLLVSLLSCGPATVTELARGLAAHRQARDELTICRRLNKLQEGGVLGSVKSKGQPSIWHVTGCDPDDVALAVNNVWKRRFQPPLPRRL